jgi:hypothetical protein
MPVILAVLAIAGTVAFWVYRARNVGQVASDVADMAETVLGAARRFGFRRRADRHPVESIDDPKVAVGGLATAFLELSGLPTTEEKQALVVGLQSTLGLSHADAEEMTILGHWFVNCSGGASPAVARLARRVNKLAGAEGLTQTMEIVRRIAEAAGGVLSPQQGEAIDEMKRVFRIR